jgi:hypothetical protein
MAILIGEEPPGVGLGRPGLNLRTCINQSLPKLGRNSGRQQEWP